MENFQSIDETIINLQQTLNPKLGSRLPLEDDEANELRIINVLNDFVQKRRRFSSRTLITYLNEYQKTHHLTLAELWFVAPALQALAIIELESILRPIFSKQGTKLNGEVEAKIKYLILTLIHSTKVNWKKLVEGTSYVEHILRSDPAGIYPLMDFKTRDTYRHAVENLAQRSRANEFIVADLILKMAKDKRTVNRHVGYYLVGSEKHRLEDSIGYHQHLLEKFQSVVRKTQGKNVAYILLLTSMITTTLVMVSNFQQGQIIFGVALWLFILAGLESVINRLLIRLIPPSPLFRLDDKLPLKPESRTLVVVPTILTENSRDPHHLLQNLEMNYCANQDEQIFFGLALSFPETQKREDKPTARQLANLERLKKGLKELNQRYPRSEPAFMIFFRRRTWSDSQGVCLEWERKRGKIVELIRYLRGATDTDYDYVSADQSGLFNINYLLTLDQGELLTKGAAKKLIATISHPLNQPLVDPLKKVVTQGYGIIQPSMVGTVNRRNSLFARMIGDRGWDAYSGISSNINQDVYQEGVFFGKGILDIGVFKEVLEGRFRDNIVLSHDLIEGFYCRTGYASDIQVLEEEPTRYLAYATRKERWTRGDWQNFFWLLRKVRNQAAGSREKNPLLFYQKWWLSFNLLRSMVFPLAVLLLCYVWLGGDLQSSGSLTLVILLFLNLDSIVGLVDIVPTRYAIPAWRFYLGTLSSALLSVGLTIIFKAVFSLHLGLLSLAAASRGLIRTLITHKKTLEWQTFHQTHHRPAASFWSYVRRMFPSQVVALTLLLLYLNGSVQFLPLAILISWLMAPVFAYLYSYQWTPKRFSLPDQDRHRLRLIALKTWRFFEDTVSEKTNFLPPDHLNDIGQGRLSRMTSITNLGVYLLSLEAARSLGYLSQQEFFNRLHWTLRSVAELEKHVGHYFNWYDVNTRNPLPPRYLSTVDSGNFAAALITLKGAISELFNQRIINRATQMALGDYIIMMIRLHDEGILTNAETAKLRAKIETLRQLNSRPHYRSPRQTLTILNEIEAILSEIGEWLRKPGSKRKILGFRYWLDRTENLILETRTQLLRFYPWLGDNLEDEVLIAELGELERQITYSKLEAAVQSWEERFKDREANEGPNKLIPVYLKQVKKALAETHDSQSGLYGQLDRLLGEMEFDFLYDDDRELYHIGYNADKKRYDKGYYDLYASEARLASFVALSQNNITLEHWSKLGRPLTQNQGRLALLSWGGSIFEYFFPQLFLPTQPGSLQDLAEKTALKIQMEYAHSNSIPWGISESSYAQKNRSSDYLYKIHGVAALGIRKVSTQDKVVAPYATFLALHRNPKEAIKNVKRLQHLDAENKYGFYDAIDFTKKLNGEAVRVYMSHHQGAILLAVSNYLQNRPFERYFLNNVETKALQYLTEEKAVVRGKLKRTLPLAESRELKFDFKAKPKDESQYSGYPVVNLLSNGRFKSYISNRGSGFLEYGNLELIPFSNDPVSDMDGCHIYLADRHRAEVWSAGYQPTQVEPQDYGFFAGRNYMKIHRQNFGILSEMEVFLHPTLNAEVRALTLTNHSQSQRALRISSYAEASLFTHLEFRSQPHFQRLKLYAENRAGRALLYRKRTGKSETSPILGHMLLSPKKSGPVPHFISDRTIFFGTGDLIKPSSLFSSEQPQIASGYDDIMAAQYDLNLLPLEKQTMYFVTFFVGKPERLNSTLKQVSNYQQLRQLHQDVTRDIDWKGDSQTTPQKFISLLLYGNNRVADAVAEQQTAKNQIKIDWNLSTVVIEINQVFSTAFVTEAFELLAQLLTDGLSLNVVVVTHEKDQYSQRTHDFIEKTIADIDQERKISVRTLTDSVTVLNEAALSKELYSGLVAAADIYWNASKHSLNKLIESEFNKINV